LLLPSLPCDDWTRARPARAFFIADFTVLSPLIHFSNLPPQFHQPASSKAKKSSAEADDFFV
jgi:hypothetical protein